MGKGKVAEITLPLILQDEEGRGNFVTFTHKHTDPVAISPHGSYNIKNQLSPDQNGLLTGGGDQVKYASIRTFQGLNLVPSLFCCKE